MAVNDYYFALQNLSNSDKIFGYYSGSAIFDYKFDYFTQSASPGAGDVRLNSGSLSPYSNTNETSTTQIYIDEDDISNRESVIGYLTKLDDLSTKGQVKLEVSGSSSYYLTFDVTSIETGSYLSYMIVNVSNGSGNTPSGADNNPISQSYVASTSSYTTKKPIIVTFTGSDLRGYHEIDVTGSSTKYIVASSGSFGTPATGSIPAPFSIDWGVPESTFIDPDYYPSNQGYAWLWNDGYKVKHIKMNNRSSTGTVLSNFIKNSEWARYVMYNPVKADGSYIHTGDGWYAEDYQLYNVTQYSTQNYTHLFVNQTDENTSFAVDTSNPGNVVDTFTATGDYIVYASSSGTVLEPTKSINVDSSIPQGYFPSSSVNYPSEQFFRGWADANYYINGTLTPVNGTLDDPLQAFNSGSTERDYDSALNYVASSLPFFIDATASYISISSSNFVPYASQTRLTKIGPSFITSGGGELIYYYKEDTGQIIIRGSEYLNTQKTSTLDFDPRYDVQLVGPNDSPTTYTTLEGFDIEVKESQSLWLTRGLANIGTGDGNLWKYNRYLHRPFKTYIVTSTGSVELGYSSSIYGTDAYGSGSSPVGPPPNEFETVYIAYSSSKASDRPNDGLYTFDSSLIEPLYITASVKLGYTSVEVIRSSSYGTGSYGDDEFEYGGTGSGDDILTWETASLKLYQNSTVIAEEETHITPTNILYGLTSTLNTTLQPYEVSIGDTLKLSVEVSNESDSGFNASLVVNAYTMSFNNLVYPESDLVPVTFNNYLELNDGCDPLINNIAGDRPNQRLQDVDYSVDILNPINFDQIIRDEAVRATVPESNYTQIGFTNQRYIGSSTSRRQVNEYNELDEVDFTNQFYYPADITNPEYINKGKGPRLGKVPNIELKNGYIAYFNKIVDPYPLLNNKTAYYVKYLIDETGTIFDPTLSDINFSIFEKTFQLYDYDSKPTRVKTSLQSIEEAKELSQLNKGLSNTFKLGQYPTPILYTQTSSLGHTNNIILSGSPFFGTLGVGSDWTNYGINVNSIQTAFPLVSSLGGDFRKFTLDLPDSNPYSQLYFASGDITPFENNEVIPTSSFSSGYKIDLPLDPLGNPANTSGGDLSDNFTLNGSFELFTTTMPARYKARDRDWQKYTTLEANSLWEEGNPFSEYRQPFYFWLKPYRNGALNTTNFSIKSVELEIITSPGTSNEYHYNPIEIEKNPSGYNTQWILFSQGFKLTPDSIYLEKRILQDMLGLDWRNSSVRRENAHLIGGGYTPKQGSTTNNIEGVNGVAVVYKWKINFDFTNIKQEDDFYFDTDGEWTFAFDGGKFCSTCGNRKVRDFFHHHYGSSDFTNINSRDDAAWKGTFNPDVVTLNTQVTSFNTKPILKYNLTSPLSSNNQNANGAPGPFWRRVSGSNDMLYMSSSILNQTYGVFDEDGNNTNGNYYVQAKLDYVPGSSTDFPSTIEPDFIEFDPVVDPWSLQIGDELRFENNENLVYTITSTNGRQAIEPPTNPESTDPENDGLRIIVSPPFEDSDGNINEPSNFDFFVVRRYKENRNFIILDQQKPYGFPVSASTSPGILLPEHRIEKYDRNPDEVLKDLIEKRII
jgi:hypothetical protein